MSGIFGADSFISVQDTTVQGNGAAGLSLLGGALKLRSGVSVTGNGTALDPSLPEAGQSFTHQLREETAAAECLKPKSVPVHETGASPD